MKRLVSLFLILALTFSLSIPAAAANDAVGTTVRLKEFSGTVTVKNASGKAVTAIKDMRLYTGYTIETGKSSSAHVTLDDTKAVKLDSSGKCEIKKNGQQLEVSLISGNLYFNVDKPLATSETLNIRTATMVTGVRGSFGWVNPKQAGMVHGHATVTYVDEETGETVTTPITSGEGLAYNEEGGAATGENAGTYEKTTLTVEDIPAVVAEEIAADPEKQAQVDEVENLDTQEIIDSVEQKRAEEDAAEEQAQEEADKAAAEQEQQIAETKEEDKAAGVKDEIPFEEPKEEPKESGRDDDSGSGHSGISQPTSVTIKGSDSGAYEQLIAALSSGASVVTLDLTGLTPASGDPEPTVSGSGALTVRSGQTLNLVNNSTVEQPPALVCPSGSSNAGTINVGAGTQLTIGGSFNNTNGTIVNNGTIQNNGTITN